MKKIQIIWILVLLFEVCIGIAQTTDVALLSMDNTIESTITKLPADLIYIPFEFADKKILVTARIEGKQGTFMLDTGAPGIVLNVKQQTANTTTKKHQNTKKKSAAQDIHQEVTVHETNVGQFEWAGMTMENVEALEIDMSHLEEAVHQNLAGLIGYDVLKNAEILIDHKRKILILSNDKRSSWHKNEKPKAVLDFVLINHLPVIKTKIGKKTVYMGLDSGAEANLIDNHSYKKLDKDLILKTKKEKLIGLSGKEKNTIAAWVKSTKIDKNNFEEMKYVCTDLSKLHTDDGAKISGLLGQPFFEQNIISVNYNKRKLYIW